MEDWKIGRRREEEEEEEESRTLLPTVSGSKIPPLVFVAATTRSTNTLSIKGTSFFAKAWLMMTVASLLLQWLSTTTHDWSPLMRISFQDLKYFFSPNVSTFFLSLSLFLSPSSMTTTAVASSKVSSPWIANSRAAQKAQKRFVGSAKTTTVRTSSLRRRIVGPKKSRYDQNAHHRGRQKRITIRMENFESTPKPDGAPKCTNYYTPELVSKAIAELTAESARTAIEKRGISRWD